MDFDKEHILKLSEEVASFKEISLTDIPYIDLYMDQITTLFEDKLSHLKRDPGETILTKTMINNYAKAKIFTPVKNKKYNKQQIITLILIYNLKQILSLDDIKAIFNPIVDNLIKNTENSAMVERLYDNFLTIKAEQSGDFNGFITENINKIDELVAQEVDTDSELAKLLLTVLTLINSANMQKRMAEKLIDSFLRKKEQ